MKTGITRLVLLLAIALVAAGPAQAAPSTELEFLGQQIFPTSTQFQGTTFGGLSSIAYDESRGVFYVLSDDQVNARFYTLRIGVGGGAPAVQIVAVTTLRDASGQPFAPLSLDPEGLALTKDDTLVITSEGFANRLIDPWVREFGLDGRQLGVAAGPDRLPAERRGDARRAPEPRLRERGDAAERPLLLHRDRERARPGRPAGNRRPRAARRGCCATTSSGASSTASTSTGRIRSPSRPCPRTSSRSTASSRCCR